MEHTKQILRRVERNDPTLKTLDIGIYYSEHTTFKYHRPDLTRIGTVIANNAHLVELGVTLTENIAIEVTDENLLNGLKQNTSIQKLLLNFNSRSIAGTIIHVILSAYQVNNNLTDIHIECVRTRDDYHIITNTLMRNTNLRKIRLSDSGINDDQLLQMVEAIRGHRNMEELHLYRNSIGNGGCRVLATMLEDPNCNIRKLDLVGNDIGIEGAVALANSLATNTKLRKLDLSHNNIEEDYLGSTVQSSFSQILCNTSSIGATYSSNHTLEYLSNYTLEAIESDYAEIDELSSLIERNQLNNKSHVAIRKILQYHPNIDMEPMFEWDAEGDQTLKALPYVISWFDRAGVAVADVRGERYNVEERKLSAMFEFSLAMPLLFVPVSHIKVDSKKRKRVDKC